MATLDGVENILPHNYRRVLDQGYVGLVDHMGSDLSVVNAARVSFDKRATEWNDKQQGLLNFLHREGHTSPFRHASLTFEIYAPLMTVRQWLKYVVGSSHVEDGLAHNESSRRYITENNRFYLPSPNEWRSAPEDRKQGSGPVLPGDLGILWTEALENHYENSEALYQQAMDAGIAPEQARLFLPAYGLYVRWVWTTSLAALMHFLGERLAHDAQGEIRDYAEAVLELSRENFPASMNIVKPL